MAATAKLRDEMRPAGTSGEPIDRGGSIDELRAQCEAAVGLAPPRPPVWHQAVAA